MKLLVGAMPTPFVKCIHCYEEVSPPDIRLGPIFARDSASQESDYRDNAIITSGEHRSGVENACRLLSGVTDQILATALDLFPENIIKRDLTQDRRKMRSKL